jgi:large subunit ribosomal protein L4
METKMEAPLYAANGEKSGTVELPGAIFGVEPRKILVLKALKRHLANRRSGTACTKTRGMVSGGGAKPWPQKGTGNARQGSRRSPLWPGGGVTFGPLPRSYEIQMSATERRLAVLSVLSEKQQDRAIRICDPNGLEPKTKAFAGLLKSMDAMGPVLFLFGPEEASLARSCRNISGIRPLLWRYANVVDIMAAKTILITTEALEKLKEVWG